MAEFDKRHEVSQLLGAGQRRHESRARFRHWHQTDLTVAIGPALFKAMSRVPQRPCVIGAGMGGPAAIMLEWGAMAGGRTRFVPASQGITMRDGFAQLRPPMRLPMPFG